MIAFDQELAQTEVANSLKWCEHFGSSASRQRVVPWDQAISLNEEHRRVLLPSLQDFQLGESSEGRHGMTRAAAYGARVGDAHYAQAVRLFFAEENRHADYLARYLRLHGVEPIERSWTDFVFRRVRRLFGLEALLMVLLSAELIGEVYYRAICRATGCPALRAVCAQLLTDERMHIRFHVERLRFVRKGRGPIRRAVQDACWRVFFTATRLAVWAKHRQAFRLGDRTFRRFWSEACQSLRTTLTTINA